MRGQVLGVDRVSGEGQIAGEDGQRYIFKPEDWSDTRGPAVGLQVDFTAEGAHAARIFRVPGVVNFGERPPRASGTGPNRIVAALLAFFFGVLGIHKFYMGKGRAGVIMLLCGTIGWLLVLPGLFAAITAFVEFIIYLVTDDETFERRYVDGDRDWF